MMTAFSSRSSLSIRAIAASTSSTGLTFRRCTRSACAVASRNANSSLIHARYDGRTRKVQGRAAWVLSYALLRTAPPLEPRRFAGYVPQRRTHGDGADTGPHPGPRDWLLGLEGAAQRGRARPLLGAGGGAARARDAARAPRPSSAQRARLLRRARGARHARAPPRRVREHSGDRPLSRSSQAHLRRWAPRDAERPTLRVLGLARRGAAHGTAPERGQGGRELLRAAVRRSRSPPAVPAGDDRREPRRSQGDRTEVPLEGLPDPRRRRRGAGRDPGPGRAGPSGAHRLGLRPAGRPPDLRGVRRVLRAERPSPLPAGRLLCGSAARGRRARHGTHPARLGPRPEAPAPPQGARGAPAR